MESCFIAKIFSLRHSNLAAVTPPQIKTLWICTIHVDDLF